MAEPASGPARRRVFFAVWPDAPASGALAAAAQRAAVSCGGRPTRRENLHITLAFVGEVERERIDLLCTIGGALVSEAFDLELERLGYWRHNRIVWAGARSVPAPLAALADGLNRELRGAGYRLDEKPFAAHITLLRKANCTGDLPRVEPIRWKVAEFVLVESVLDAGGSIYTPVARFVCQR
jgi:2'-5' RNA ligase